MSSASRRGLLAVVVFAAAADLASADAVSDKQKLAAAANLKKAEIADTFAAETENFIIVTPAPEAKAKALGIALEKVYTKSRAVLQYEPTEKPWTGKLTVYYFPERRQYTMFMRAVVGQRPDEQYHLDLKGDNPFIAAAPELPGKATDADLFAEVGAAVGTATLMRKASTADFPDWIKNGFGRAVVVRTDGTSSTRYQAYKRQARTAALPGKNRPAAPIADVWSGKTKESEYLGTSLMDYIAFGPGAANFTKFVNAFKPTESIPAPGLPQAMEAAGWKEPQLEMAWRKWLVTGK